MKNTSKILALVLIIMTVLMSLTAMTASAEAPEKLYLTPSANWKESNARFAAYFFGNGETWVSMTDPDGDGVYEVAVPAGYPNVIFCRMNPSASANNWNNKWNQTSDLTIPTSGANHYTVKEGTWDKGGGTWSTFGSTCLHTNLGEVATCTTPQVCLDCGDPVVSALGHTYDATHLCTRCSVQATFTVAGSGAHLGTEWDTGNTANDMTYDATTGTYTKVYENVAMGSYAFKVARDHDWGTAYPSADKAYTVSTAGSTVTITLKGTTVTVDVVAPHVHDYVGTETTPATCTEAGVMTYACECGEGTYTEVIEALGHDIVVDVAKDATCTETGLTAGEHCSRCDYKVAQEEVAALGHDYVDGVCSRCTAEDPNYVPPHEHNFVDGKCECGEEDPNYVPPVVGPVDPIVNISDLAAGTTDGGELIPGTGISASAGLTIDSNKKSIDGFDFTLRLKLGGKMEINEDGSIKAGVKIVTDGAANIVVYAISSSSSDSTRTLQIASLVDGAFVKLGETAGVDGAAIAKYELTVDAAGTYYLGSTKSGINIYYIAVEAAEVEPPHEHNFVDGKCECGEEDPNYVPPHVNALVVGDTNKIVIGDAAVDNGFGFLVESVFFVVDEKAHYEFVGEGLTILVYDTSMNNLCGYTGKADLEVGTYIICIAANTPNTKGEFNVAVTKSEIVVPEHENKLVIGENNKIVVDGSVINQNNNPIAWVPFVVTEKAHYALTSETEGALVYIFDSTLNILCGGTGAAVLEPGAYLVCVGNGAIGDIYVQVTKTEIPSVCEHNWVYMSCTLCGEPNPNFAHNNLIAGANNVICNEYHLVDTTGHGNPYQFVLLTLEEDGLYVFTCDKLIGITIFTTEITDPDADFTAGTGKSWTVYEVGQAELKAGTYYIGFIYVEGVGEYTVNIDKHEHAHESVVTAPTCTEAGYTTYTCSCGDTYVADEVEALGHDYVDGVCSRCEAADPDYVAPQPPVDEDPKDEPTDEPTEEPKLGFFDKIMKAIKDFFGKIMAFFKGMFKF